MLLGFSTGCIFKTYPSASKEAVDACLEAGTNAIEISVISVAEVADLKANMAAMADSVSKFEYVSIHAPAGRVRLGNDPKTREMLGTIKEAYDLFGSHCLVVHPNVIENWRIFDGLGFDIAVENLSGDVPFLDADQLRPIFNGNPGYRMTLDINHAYRKYDSPILADELIAAFPERIAEIHLSGYVSGHDLVFRTRQTDMLECLKGKDWPIIIESECGSVGDMKEEFAYLRSELA